MQSYPVHSVLARAHTPFNSLSLSMFTPIRLYPHGYDWLRYSIGFRSPVLVEGCRRPPPRGFKIWFQIIPWNGPVDLSPRSRCNYAWLDSFGRRQINSLLVRSVSLPPLSSLFVSFSFHQSTLNYYFCQRVRKFEFGESEQFYFETRNFDGFTNRR